MDIESNYSKYRGKCKEFCEELIKKDPTLKMVRGYYWCPLSGDHQHWWCVDIDGNIVDPTVKQFPTGGAGAEYTEFDGYVNCEHCGKRIHEDECVMMGRFPVCSESCGLRLVGL